MKFLGENCCWFWFKFIIWLIFVQMSQINPPTSSMTNLNFFSLKLWKKNQKYYILIGNVSFCVEKYHIRSRSFDRHCKYIENNDFFSRINKKHTHTHREKKKKIQKDRVQHSRTETEFQKRKHRRKKKWYIKQEQ